MLNRCFIIGSGNSRQEGIDKGIHDLLKNEITFAINEEFNFFDPTVIVYGDWTFYAKRKELLKKHPLIIGRYDGAYIREKSCSPLPQLLLLKSSSRYYGKDSLQQGIFCSVLTGLFTLTLAIALGFSEIYLLGFDECEINGKTHHYQDNVKFGHFLNELNQPRTGIGKKENGEYNTGVYNKSPKLMQQEYWNNYRQEFLTTKIYNVSLESKIAVFPKISYDNLIKYLKLKSFYINQSNTQTYIREYLLKNASNIIYNFS